MKFLEKAREMNTITKLLIKAITMHSNWVQWAATKFQKKGYLAETVICAYGNEQIVGEVRKFGGGYVFWSKACAGCRVGARLIEDYQKTKKFTESTTMCALLENALFTKAKVSEGDIYNLLPLELRKKK